MKKQIRRFVLVFAAAVAVTAAPAALADAVYHSEHMKLRSVAGAPLRSGFVQNIHPNGPNVYAHEIYVLNGAEPNTTYQVVLRVDLFDPSCSGGDAVAFRTTELTTNRAGNGRAELVLTPADIPGPVRNNTTAHGVYWQVFKGGMLVYQTDCTEVLLD